MTRTLARAVWRRGRWLFAGVFVLALLWLHLGVLFPRPTQTLVIRSEVPLFNVQVTVNGTEIEGRFRDIAARTLFAWAIPGGERPIRFVVAWNTADGRAERLEHTGQFEKEPGHCIHSLRVNAEGRAGRDDWMRICHCEPTDSALLSALQGECL